MKKIIAAIIALLVIAVLAPMGIGLISNNSGNYTTAANLLKFYPFLKTQYLDAVRGAGDQYMEDGDYSEAISWYEQLGKGGTESVGSAYCAMALENLEKDASVSRFLDSLGKIPETSDMIPFRDQAILDAASYLISQNSLEDAASLLLHVVSADVSSVRNQINAVYIQEALGCLTEITIERAKGDVREPEAFEPMRAAVESLNKCEESALAKYFSKALNSLLNRNIDGYMSAVVLVSQEDSDPLAGETAWTLWNCFGHMASSNNTAFLGNDLPYDILNKVISAGNAAAKLADPADTHSGSLLDSLAELAKDGEVRRWKQGLCMHDFPLTMRLDKFGGKAGDQPKLLFIRNYLPASSAPQEYCMEFGIDLEMMSLLPLEYWPSSMADVTHIVSLHYFHEKAAEYTSNDILKFKRYDGIKETACVRVYSTADGQIIYESESLTGPNLPSAVSSDQIVGGYYSSGEIDLSQQLIQAMQEVFPEIK